MPFPVAPADWLRRRYSYAAVLALTGVGVAFPAAAGLLLGVPLAVGMVVLGVAHGACDQWVVPAGAPSAGGWRYWLRFLAGYLGLAALVGVLWWQWPAATVGLFFVLTVWHWGSADAPAATQVPRTWWLGHSLLRGLFLFAVPAWRWPAETADVVNGLLTFAGAPTLGAAAFAGGVAGLGLLVGGGHLALWALYARHRRWAWLTTELVEVAVLAALFVAVPPRLSVGVYFVFWHSLQHVLRMNHWLGYTAPRARPALLPQLAFFLRRAAPLLLVSCAALLGLGYLLAGRLPNPAAWFSLALVVASVVTLPHALLVTLVMDAGYWQRPQPNATAG
ncbi:MAG TPA: Brp/Blh family beta-carotene 15,15'-dioxygenase [Hymenobacter sp.]|jgi:Brp/Blh family beta-carotene 15,15'-monooxygenase|uniref:Brp/Blh family beta-carotene 15,15'-dioxygenase n=1 Tax=Hymenobacter sp. TaxID=1898978 RepID=UPI002EDAD9AD